MQKIHFLYNFLVVIATLIACAIAGEFYLSTLLLLLPVYYFAYVIYLAASYRKKAARSAFRQQWLWLLPASFLIYIAAFAAAVIIWRQIDRSVAVEIENIPPCATHENCSEAVVLTYHHLLEKRFFLTRDNRCVHLRSPAYALVKSEHDYCQRAGEKP